MVVIGLIPAPQNRQELKIYILLALFVTGIVLFLIFNGYNELINRIYDIGYNFWFYFDIVAIIFLIGLYFYNKFF